MEKTRLGRTGLMVTRTAFGALPIQRVGMEEAGRLLRRAYEAGINFFDTAHSYTDSEEKIGRALSSVRDKLVIATKSPAADGATLTKHLELSLKRMKTDYVDILQLHNPGALPDPEDASSTYAALVEARRKGMVRFIGISNHRLTVARDAVRSGLFDTLQFPLSVVSSDEDFGVVEECARQDVGLIAMKALAGGLITSARAAFAFLRKFENVVPIWGIQRESELEEFIALEAAPPRIDSRIEDEIGRCRRELAGDFCRGCGYCLPCPAGIPINNAARMSLLLRRAPQEGFLSEAWRLDMLKIEECLDCGQCRQRCPYGLDTPALLRRNLEDYLTFFEPAS